jgi:hypothetical protein
MDDALIRSVSSVSLVFGLDWLPVLSGRAGRVARRMARQYRATHLVIAGDAAAAVGLACLKSKGSDRRRPLYSAAQNVARLYATGTVALLLELGEGHHWLVAVHDGAVVARTDKMYVSAQQARHELDELRQAFPQLVVLGEARSPEVPDLSAIAAAGGGHSRLQRVGRGYFGLPALTRWILPSLILALLLPRVWAVLRPPAQKAQPVSIVDAGQVWRAAHKRAGQAVPIQGVQGTRAVLDSFYRLPIRVAGWSLVNASCEPVPSHWQCRARYKRIGLRADNSTLIQAALPGWDIDFVSIDQAEPVWRVAAAAVSLSQVSVNDSAHNERHLWSALQAIQPAFASMQLGRPVPMRVIAPRDAQARPIDRPRGLPVYTLRQVRFDGPLRSASLLLPYTGFISWKKLALSVHDMRTVDLKSSRLTLSLYGDLYEIQSEPADSVGTTLASSAHEAAGGSPP